MTLAAMTDSQNNDLLINQKQHLQLTREESYQ